MSRIQLTPESYESAFQCFRDGSCPQQAGVAGCPMWLEVKHEIAATGEEKEVVGCAPAILADLVAGATVQSIRAANTAGAARDESSRLAQSSSKLLQTLLGVIHGRPPEIVEVESPTPQLERTTE